jgi:misacylated tRNA(Ala) deacylase
LLLPQVRESEVVTERLYERDAYLRDFDAVVVARDKTFYVLDRTAFRPASDGQPHDTGPMVGPASPLWVGDVRADRDNVWHGVGLSGTAARRLHYPRPAAAAKPATEDEPGSKEAVSLLLHVGDHVHGQVSWDRRYALMRSYTALRLAKETLMRQWRERVEGGFVDRLSAYLDIASATLPADFRPALEERINEDIERDRAITVLFDGATRRVGVEGGSTQPDSGLYVRSTTEVGSVRVLKERRRHASKRLRLDITPNLRQ